MKKITPLLLFAVAVFLMAGCQNVTQNQNDVYENDDLAAPTEPILVNQEEVYLYYEDIYAHFGFLLGGFGEDVATLTLMESADLKVVVYDEDFTQIIEAAKTDLHIAGVIRETFLTMSEEIYLTHGLNGVEIRVHTRANEDAPFLIIKDGHVLMQTLAEDV